MTSAWVLFGTKRIPASLEEGERGPLVVDMRGRDVPRTWAGLWNEAKIWAERRPGSRVADGEELLLLVERADRAADQGLWLVAPDGSHRRS